MAATTLVERPARRVESWAQERIRVDLHRVAVDIIGRCEHDELTSDEKSLLHEVMFGAIDDVMPDLIDEFDEALDRRIRVLSPGLRLRLERARDQRRLGFD